LAKNVKNSLDAFLIQGYFIQIEIEKPEQSWGQQWEVGELKMEN
jgi:hypothetical protein